MNRVKEKLARGEVTIGSWMQLASASVAHIMGHAGYDWVAVDLEHGLIGVERLPLLCHALERGGTLPMARVARVDSKDVKHALEAGCRGLIFPMIESREQFEAAAAWATYPPHGRRGVGFAEANLFGKWFAQCVPGDPADRVLVAQIESAAAVDRIERILAADRLDAVLIGPYDLSASLGAPGDFTHPAFREAVDRVAAAARDAGVPLGRHVVEPSPRDLAAAVAEGCRFIAYGIDALFLHRAAECPPLGGGDHAG